MGEKLSEGWGVEKPHNKRKYCYFVGSMSLCKNWGFYNGELEQGNDDHSENCSTCKRLLKARNKKESKENEK